jgi:hypothetical protein
MEEGAMIANSPAASEIATFVADELRRVSDSFVIGNVFRNSCDEAVLITDGQRRPLLVLWMDCAWSYSYFIEEEILQCIAESAGEYTDHILGITAAPLVAIGLKAENL